jgi:hypothetical protein
VLTAAEMAALDTALGALDARAGSLEAAYRDARNLLWFVYEDDTTARAREVAEGARATYERARARRDELVEYQGPDAHELVLSYVEAARNIARDGLAGLVAAELQSTPDRLPFYVAAAKGTASTLFETGAASLRALPAAVGVLVVVVGLLVAWQAVRAFGGRRA